MKGSIRKRKKNAWSYRIDLGFVDGKRKQVEKGGLKTEREAVKAMQDALYHLNNTGDYVENKKISFHLLHSIRPFPPAVVAAPVAVEEPPTTFSTTNPTAAPSTRMSGTRRIP